MAPDRSRPLPHVAGYWLIVMFLFLGHFRDPGVPGGSLRPPGAAACRCPAPKNLQRPFPSSLPPTALPDGSF